MGGDQDNPGRRAREPAREPTGAGAVLRNLARFAVVVALAYGIHLLIGWANGAAEEPVSAAPIEVIVALVIVYTILIATPFVPGIEIGVTLLMMEGPWIAPLVYAATVFGLMLAFCIGVWVPDRGLRRALEDLHLRRACDLLDRVLPLSLEDRVAALEARVPQILRPFVIRLRYLLIALLVNLPGNAVIGGGGGILIVAGLSRLFRPAAMVLTVALAVAPVPLAVWFFGIDLLH